MRVNALAVVVRFATLDALVLGIGTTVFRHLGRFLTGSRCHVLLLVMVCTKRFIAHGTHELPQPHVLVVFAVFAKELPFDVLLALVTLARIGRRTFGTDGGRPVQLVHVSDVPVEDASLGVTLDKIKLVKYLSNKYLNKGNTFPHSSHLNSFVSSKVSLPKALLPGVGC